MNQFSQLVKLVRKSYIQKVAEMLQYTTININYLDPKSGKGLLQLAMYNSDTDMFNMLADFPGINPYLLNHYNYSTLYTAIRLNYPLYVTRLLTLGINPRRKNKQGYTSLCLAIKYQTNQDILYRLLQQKFDLKYHIDYYGSYVNLAIMSNQFPNLTFLLKYYANYTYTDDNDNTSLLLAVKYNHGDMLIVLLEHLAKDLSLTKIYKQFFINAQNRSGNTALHYAYLQGLQTISERLEKMGKEFGIDVSIRNKELQTIQDIREAMQRKRLLETESEKKRVEYKVIRKREAYEEKAKQRKQDEMLRQLEEANKKKAEEKMKIAIKSKRKLKQKYKMWIFVIIMVALSGILYVAFQYQIKRYNDYL